MLSQGLWDTHVHTSQALGQQAQPRTCHAKQAGTPPYAHYKNSPFQSWPWGLFPEVLPRLWLHLAVVTIGSLRLHIPAPPMLPSSRVTTRSVAYKPCPSRPAQGRGGVGWGGVGDRESQLEEAPRYPPSLSDNWQENKENLI